jgi:hypothetical protein
MIAQFLDGRLMSHERRSATRDGTLTQQASWRHSSNSDRVWWVG